MLLKIFDFGLVGLLYPHFTGPLRGFIVKLGIVKLVVKLTGLVLLLYYRLGLPQATHLHVVLSILLVINSELFLLLFQGVFPRVSQSCGARLKRCAFVVDLAADTGERNGLQKLSAARCCGAMQFLSGGYHGPRQLLVNFEVMDRRFLRTLAPAEIPRSIPVRRPLPNTIPVHAFEIKGYFLRSFFAELIELIYILLAYSQAMQFEWLAIL